jgi:hypothetical protein
MLQEVHSFSVANVFFRSSSLAASLSDYYYFLGLKRLLVFTCTL